MNFGLIGISGFIAPRHLKAIKETGNELSVGYDPNDSVGIIDSYFPASEFFTQFNEFDKYVESLNGDGKLNYVSICSPNYLHYTHVKYGLGIGAKVICEKPLVLHEHDLDKLIEEEKKYGGRVNTILQLRLHPAIIEFKKQLEARPRDKKIDVDLVYITSRGKWYQTSWKGDPLKSGGVAMNIGIHFFDMLSFLFGKKQLSKVNHMSSTKAGGVLEFDNATVRWFLSVDEKDLSETIRAQGKRTYRSILFDGKELEFSEGFTDLHTRSYESILSGNGFSLEESRDAIAIGEEIMNAPPIGLVGDYHPYFKNVQL